MDAPGSVVTSGVCEKGRRMDYSGEEIRGNGYRLSPSESGAQHKLEAQALNEQILKGSAQKSSRASLMFPTGFKPYGLDDEAPTKPNGAEPSLDSAPPPLN